MKKPQGCYYGDTRELAVPREPELTFQCQELRENLTASVDCDYGVIGNFGDLEDFGDFRYFEDFRYFKDFSNFWYFSDFGDFSNLRDSGDFGDFECFRDLEDFGNFGYFKAYSNFGYSNGFGDFSNFGHFEQFGDIEEDAAILSLGTDQGDPGSRSRPPVISSTASPGVVCQRSQGNSFTRGHRHPQVPPPIESSIPVIFDPSPVSPAFNNYATFEIGHPAASNILKEGLKALELEVNRDSTFSERLVSPLPEDRQVDSAGKERKKKDDDVELSESVGCNLTATGTTYPRLVSGCVRNRRKFREYGTMRSS
ncbi:hypothetical protein WN55_08021 [Dufourea novaeangliae]|uniref:Uncharacterized protein n=1 Tax=Dufourea novaeangliae TaxID=178035 RepID=A0A154P785_DUFNO|nr:hypothetical protein WN55_08021 [Dufourea novaeangliae]